MKFLFRILLVVAVSGMLGFSIAYHVPQAKTWILTTLSEQSYKHAPIGVFASRIEFHLFPLGASLHDVRLVPKNELAKIIAPAQIEAAHFELHLLKLLTGYLGLSEIRIVRPRVTAVIPKLDPKMPPSQLHLASLIQDILRLPIYKVTIEDLSLQMKDANSNFRSKVERLKIGLNNRVHSLAIEIATQDLSIKGAEDATALGSMVVSAKAIVTPRMLSLTSFKIARDRSYIIASGQAQGPLDNFEETAIEANAKVLLKASETRNWIVSLFPQAAIPNMSGYIQTRLQLRKGKQEKPDFEAQIRTVQLSVHESKIGRVMADATYSHPILKIPSVEVRNPAGTFEIADFNFNVNESKASGTLIPRPLELHKLLKELGVGDIPVSLILTGRVPCEAKLSPEFQAHCKGQATIQDLQVSNSTDPKLAKTIVAVNDIRLDGQVMVNSTGVYPEARIQVGSSQGTSKGKVEYKQGFDFTFNTKSLDFKDIRNLSNLKVEGAAALTGRTRGDSSFGVVDIQADGKQMWLEDYGLGDLQANIKYAKGHLLFTGIEGRSRSTRYNGLIDLDLDQSAVSGQVDLPVVEALDIQQGLERKVQLPFDIVATGQAKATFDGPLDFPTLSYKLNSVFYRGQIGKEGFDELKFAVTSEKGMVRTDEAYLKKNKGRIQLQANVEPTGKIEGKVTARNMLIEESEFFLSTGLNISGILEGDLKLEDHLPRPSMDFTGRASGLQLGNDPLPDSEIALKSDSKAYSGEAEILGGDIRSAFRIPLAENGPFRFKLETKNWNFAPLMALITSDFNTTEYDTELSAQIDLRSDEGGFWKSTGPIRIESFRIQRGTIDFFAPLPIEARMDRGAFNIRNFTMHGDDTFLQVKAINNTEDNLNLNINGKLDLGLLGFLTPFLSDIRGILSISTQINGPAVSPKILGTAFLERGFAKPRALPHALEDVRIDLDFTQDRILVSRLETRLAGGTARCEGVIDLKSWILLPAKLSGSFEGVELKFPAGVASKGSGTFEVTGDYFPYTFKSKYIVESGLVTTTFMEETDSGGLVKRSALLPPVILKKQFEPFLLNVDIDFTKPVQVKNAFFDTTVTGNLNVQGTPEAPQILGEVVAAEKGKLFFRDVPFSIGNANLKFTDPKEINPVVYAVASAQVRDRLREYQVNMVVQGTVRSNQILLQSQPPLPDQEIISLLALGFTSNDLSQDIRREDQASRQSYELGSAILSKNPLNDELRRRYGVDVRFSSSIDRLNNAAVSKIVLNKQWTPTLGTSASRTIGSKTVQDVKLEYLMNNNVSLIGSWEGRTFDEEVGDRVESLNFFGLDLQYKVDFR